MTSPPTFAAAVIIAAAIISVRPSAGATAPDPRNFAIAGVKLDMTVEQAEAALKAHDPELQIEVHSEKSADGTTDLYLNAIKPDAAYPRRYSEEIAVAFTRSEPRRAFTITHDLGLPPGHERMFADVVKEITETYGAQPKTTAGFHDWVFDTSGAPIDGTPDPTTAETSERFGACWHGLFETTTSLFRFNFGQVAPNGLPVAFRPSCGVSVRVIVQTYDRAQPTVVQEIVERLVSDALAVADGRSTQEVETTPEQLLRRINPHGPDVKNPEARGADAKTPL